MSDALKKLHDYLAKSPSVVYPEDVLAYLPAIEDENAKLRELLASIISNYVDGYMDGTSARYPCDLCDESSMQQCDYQHDGQCPFYSQLRKLGIEVDG